ncbi:MAG: type IV secretory system conjugative DNA transfer family protein [Pseudomonadota bacterium]
MARDFLDTPLLQLSELDKVTVRDACQGVLVTGGIGSGKTSGPGEAIAAALLRAGMGGLVLCAKPEEADRWRRLCAQHGRFNSLLEFNGQTPGFNFIAYELARHGAQSLGNVIDCLMRVIEIANAASPMPGRAGESFWLDTMRQMLRASVGVVYAATGTVEIDTLLRFIRSAPTSPEQMTDRQWQHQSSFFHLFAQAAERLDDESGARASSYWRHDFAMLDAKTRGNILISLTTALDRFNHGWLRTAFCGQTTFAPELCFHGAILLLDMPALTRNEDGIIAQQLFKYMWQRAVLARNALDPSQQERPVFLYADEAQYFINSYDAEFLSTCRGSRVVMVYLSQSLPTFYARMGGDQAHDRVHYLLGNFATRIWCSNACAETNEWAAKTIGRTLHERGSYNRSEGSNQSFGANMGHGSNWGGNSSFGSSLSHSSGNGAGGSWSSGSTSSHGNSWGGNDNEGRSRNQGTNSGESWGYSQQMDYLIEPAEFGRMLKTGGPANGNRVSAVWYQAGRTFRASGGNALLAEFVQ